MKSFNIIQWNIKGLFNNYIDFQLILKGQTPQFISLQETHLPYNSSFLPPKGYDCFLKNHPTSLTAKIELAYSYPTTFPIIK